MIKKIVFAIILAWTTIGAQAQVFEPAEEPRTVRTEGFWQNWFVQPVTGHNWPRFAVNTIASVGVAYAGKTAL